MLEGWDVITLAFAASVLLLLGLEPRPRNVTPIYNRLPRGFPHRALSVRSVTNSKPGSLIYSVTVSPQGIPTLSSYYSIYSNSLLGHYGCKSLLHGFLGRSLLGNDEIDTRLRPADGEDAVNNSSSLQSANALDRL